jgi:hypothetical protein
MSIPGLFFGQAEDDGVLACGEGYTDAGEEYTARVRSNPVVPDDTDERMWFAVYLTLAHRVEASDPMAADSVDLTVRAIVDDAEVTEDTIQLSLEPVTDPGNPPSRVRRTYEVAFAVPRFRGLVEVGKDVPSGTNFQLELEWPGSDVAVDAAWVEVEETGEVRIPA